MKSLRGYAVSLLLDTAYVVKNQHSSNIFVLAPNYAPFSLSSQKTPGLLHLSTLKQLSLLHHVVTAIADRIRGAASGLRPYHFTYPERKLTKEEMLYKFIDEGKCEHEEMRAFICDFQTTNELLFKERNNSLIELKFGVLSSIVKQASIKRKRPREFTIPCDIGQLHINNDLADLGASISLMPYTMYEKLGLGEPKATRMSLELADRSIQYPRGIIENVLKKVDKFVLPINFVILDMPEDSRVPIILGRPFLATARAMIDVFNKKITLRVGDDEVIFDVDQSIKRPPAEDDECYGIDDLDDTINAKAQKLLANEEPDSFISRGLEKSIDQSDLEGCESGEHKTDNDSDSDKTIRCISSINTPYPVAQETTKPVKVEREHLYSASANEIDEKKPGLKDLPHHLEYAYLHGDKSFPIIISSELSDKEKVSLLQVLEK
ncbi:DNA-directed DNA polymerase [Tanacetum coccineum]